MANLVNKKNTPIIILVVLVIVGYLFIGRNNLSLPSGIASIACTQPTFNSNDAFYHNGTLQCTFAATGNSQYYETTISPSDAQSLFGVTTAQNVRITAQVLSDNCRYSFNNISYPIYSYTIQTNDITTGNGRWICRASVVNPPYDSATVQASRGTYLGTTPIICNSPDCNFGYSASGCIDVWKKQIGTIYQLDPGSKHYDYSVRINMSVNNQTYSAILNSQNRSVSSGLTSVMTEAFRAQTLFAGKGDLDCPAVTDTDTAAYITNSATNPLAYVSAAQARNVITIGSGIIDLNTAVLNGNAYNTQVGLMASSRPVIGQYLYFNTTPATSIQSASVILTPSGTVSIPVITMYMNLASIGTHIPSGTPEIINVSTGRVLAATRSEIYVTGRNTGSETDSFDFSVQCPRDVSPYSTRASLSPNQISNVTIDYQGAGFIGTCNITMRSVNSPQNSVTQSVKLDIAPFCTRQATNPAQMQVFTEQGCNFICPNYEGTIDVFDESCAQITSYNRCTDANCSQAYSYSGIHCTSVGHYMTTNNYLDAVVSGTIQPFIPISQAHQYFLTQVDNNPVCAYVNEYGYSNGQALNEVTFAYGQPYPAAQREAFSNLQLNNQSNQPINPTTAPTLPAPVQVQQPIYQPPVNISQYIPYALGLVIIIGGVYYFTRRRRR